MPPPAPKPKPGASGKPGGLPIWAWGAAAALGLVLGLVFFRRGAASTAAAEDSPDVGSPQASGESAPGGVVAIPPELLAALGLRPPGSGSSFNQQPPAEGAAGSEQPAVVSNDQAQADPAPAFDLTAEYVASQSGLTVAPAGTTVYDYATQTTYDVSGTPEFSPSNYNPNSPQGVLAMNKAMASAGLAPSGTAPAPTAAPLGTTTIDTVQPLANRFSGHQAV